MLLWGSWEPHGIFTRCSRCPDGVCIRGEVPKMSFCEVCKITPPAYPSLAVATLRHRIESRVGDARRENTNALVGMATSCQKNHQRQQQHSIRKTSAAVCVDLSQVKAYERGKMSTQLNALYRASLTLQACGALSLKISEQHGTKNTAATCPTCFSLRQYAAKTRPGTRPLRLSWTCLRGDPFPRLWILYPSTPKCKYDVVQACARGMGWTICKGAHDDKRNGGGVQAGGGGRWDLFWTDTSVSLEVRDLSDASSPFQIFSISCPSKGSSTKIIERRGSHEKEAGRISYLRGP